MTPRPRTHPLSAYGACALAFAALSACIPTSPRDRGDLHDALVERTGYGVGEEDRTQPTMPEGIKIEDGLTEDEAISIALWNQPDLQVALTRLGFAKGDLQEAGALPNPFFALLLPLGPKQLEITLFQSIAALWRRPYKVEAASRDVERVAEMLVASGLDTVRDTRVAFAQLYLAQNRLQLLQKAAQTWQRMHGLAKVRLSAGAASQLELTSVATDARAVELEVLRQQNLVAQRRAELANLVFLPAAQQAAWDTMILVDPEAPSAPGAIAALLKHALAARPEVRAAELSMEAAGARAGVAKAEIFDFMLIADANGSGTQGFELGPGAQITLPIFYQNQGARTRAEAEFLQATWRYQAAHASITREVKVAHAQLTRAQAALSAWPTEVVGPLQTNVSRAQSAYQAGGATYLQVLEATRRLIDAQLQGLELEREARRASAELFRSVGGKLK